MGDGTKIQWTDAYCFIASSAAATSARENKKCLR